MPIEIAKINFKKHYFSRTSEQVKEIAKPLHRFGITMFDHFRIYEDNSGIDLTTIPEFCEFFAKNHLYREGCVGNFDDYHDGYYFWDTLLGSSVVFKAIEEQCHAGNGIIVIKTYEHYCDQFHFGAALDNSGIKNFFINQKDIIECFIAYYYREAEHLISNARQHSYAFPSDKKECDELLKLNDFDKKKGFDFNRCLAVSKVISPLCEKVPLTERELQCAYYSSLGEPAKVVAGHLSIAKRTVERHLENARIKLGVKNKIALLKAINDINLGLPLPEK